MRTDYKNEDGELHRVNAPARVWDNGEYTWYYQDCVHRFYGPASNWIGHDEYWVLGIKIR